MKTLLNFDGFSENSFEILIMLSRSWGPINTHKREFIIRSPFQNKVRSILRRGLYSLGEWWDICAYVLRHVTFHVIHIEISTHLEDDGTLAQQGKIHHLQRPRVLAHPSEISTNQWNENSPSFFISMTCSIENYEQQLLNYHYWDLLDASIASNRKFLGIFRHWSLVMFRSPWKMSTEKNGSKIWDNLWKASTHLVMM